jgi:tRNA nucleotidyltransferase (CCA-adding enzyme)
MSYFNLKPGKEIGIIKEFIKDSILDGKIANNYESAKSLMNEKGIQMGLNINK